MNLNNMKEKQKITYIKRFDKIGKKGAYVSVSIKTDRHDKYLSGFGNEINAKWQIGDEIEIEVVQKGEYWNFNMPKVERQIQNSGQLTDLIRMVGQLDTRFGKIEHYLQQLLPIPKGTKVAGTDIDYPTDDLGESPF